MADEVVAGRDEDLPDQHRNRRRKLADAETNVADDLRAEALLQFAQNLGFGNLLELVMQGGLKHADGKDSSAQANRARMSGDEFADNCFPGVDHFTLAQTLAQSELLHEFREQVSRRLPAIGPCFVRRK